jgi:DNA-binding GntR family transcriptional regulator
MSTNAAQNVTLKAETVRGRGGLADQVSRQIADEIVLGHFAPGTRLDEMSLAKRYAVSRTPVREALKQLEIMGFVESRLNRGSIVAAMSAEQVDQMFETIGELEAACARHAAVRMSEAEKARLREIHRQGRAVMQAGDVEGYDKANLDFHLALIHGCHNPVLIDLTLSLRHRVSPFRRTQFRNVERIGASFEEHSLIVEAIHAHDVAMAYREMRVHLLSARTASARVAPLFASAPATPEIEAERLK